MPLLLLAPLLVLLLLAAWLVLLPISLWARYASGRARRRAQGWFIGGNAWLLALLLPVFLVTAWIATFWMDDALRDACLGILIGVVVGIVGVWLTRFERDAKGWTYTPNRWVVLALTSIVALRVLAGLWMAWRHLSGGVPGALADWLDAGAWMGIAGVFLGYGLAYIARRATVRAAVAMARPPPVSFLRQPTSHGCRGCRCTGGTRSCSGRSRKAARNSTPPCPHSSRSLRCRTSGP